ncbi:Threonine--tRNA ligase 1 [Anaerolineae bacterium]|nr:Threonine--tRNA ligase 1 [Anaerolineae bacterium]
MPDDLSQIQLCDYRKDVQVRFADGRVFSGPSGTRLESFVRKASPPPAIPIVAAVVNGRLAELSEPQIADVDVEPISLASEDGMRIYHRSMIFLLQFAARELFKARITVDYSLTYGGVFCRVLARDPFTEAEVTQIEARMRALVNEDVPIVRETMRVADAINLFHAQGDEEQVRLLSQHEREEIRVHSLRDLKRYFLGGMLVPSTGYLKQFALRAYSPGFILQFPQRNRPTSLEPPRQSPKLISVFLEYRQWLGLLGVTDAGLLNQALLESRAREIVFVSEALHAQRIAEIASDIVSHRDRLRLIAMAGPSSSGKTTFARRLTIQLLANGLRPFPVSLDDYFVTRDETPRDASGEYDYENLNALDLALFNEHLLALMNGERVTFPKYNFETGERETGHSVQLSADHILLIEGIHGLNPNLVPRIPPERIYRIYISALTQLKLDRLNRVPTTDTRLIRRIVRDAETRGYSAQETIARWESVRRGEERNIFPYQEQADIMFNSALAYELAALKPLAEPLLRQVEPGTPEYVEARRLLTFLQWFHVCTTDFVPEDSILREFIGGSLVADFVPHI